MKKKKNSDNGTIRFVIDIHLIYFRGDPFVRVIILASSRHRHTWRTINPCDDEAGGD